MAVRSHVGAQPWPPGPGRIADPGREGDETIIIREALDAVRAADSYTTTLLTVGNGLLVAVKD